MSLFVSAETVADSDKYFSLHTQREYGVRRLSKRTRTLDEDIAFIEVSFFLDLEIGSHRDRVMVLLDTGSSDFGSPAGMYAPPNTATMTVSRPKTVRSTVPSTQKVKDFPLQLHRILF